MSMLRENDGEYFYKVLDLNKDCSSHQLKTAYKKLALKWHPDRIPASKSAEFKDRAKKNFQTINQAYTVISDPKKRFLYDLGLYDNTDEDDQNGMGDFLGQMSTLMQESKPVENEKDSFDDLQNMFVDMFGSMNDFLPQMPIMQATPSSYYTSSFMSREAPSEFSFEGNISQTFRPTDQSFCFGTQDSAATPSSRARKDRRNGTNQRKTGRRGCGIPAMY